MGRRVLFAALTAFCIICHSPRSWATSDTKTIGSRVVANLTGFCVASNGDTYYTGSDRNGIIRLSSLSSSKTSPTVQLPSIENISLLGPIACDTKYLYLVVNVLPSRSSKQDGPDHNRSWTGVLRLFRSGVLAPFTNGRGPNKSIMVVAESNQGAEPTINGIAIDSNQYMYLTETVLNSVMIYRTLTMVPHSSFVVQKPSAICGAYGGGIWLVQKNSKGADAGYAAGKITSDGKLAGPAFPIPYPMSVSSIASDRSGNVYVLDQSRAGKIRLFKGPARLFTEATKPELDKINAVDRGYEGLKFLGTDEAGNLAAGHSAPGGGVIVTQFNTKGQVRNQTSTLFEANASTIVENTKDVVTGNALWKAPLNSERKYQNMSINPHLYPNDFRLQVPSTTLPKPEILNLKGHRFLVLSGVGQQALCIYRYDKETAIPSVIFASATINSGLWQPPFQPQNARWIWRDSNGNGQMDEGEYFYIGDKTDPVGTRWSVAPNGDVYQTNPEIPGSFTIWNVQGLDKLGNPIYKRSATQVITIKECISPIIDIKFSKDGETVYFFTSTSKLRNDSVSNNSVVVVENWGTGNRSSSKSLNITNTKSTDFVCAWDVIRGYLVIVKSNHLEVFDSNDMSKVAEAKLPNEFLAQSVTGNLDTHYNLNLLIHAPCWTKPLQISVHHNTAR